MRAKPASWVRIPPSPPEGSESIHRGTKNRGWIDWSSASLGRLGPNVIDGFEDKSGESLAKSSSSSRTAFRRHAVDVGGSLWRAGTREGRSAPAAPLKWLPSPFGLRQAIGHCIDHGGVHGHAHVAADDFDALGVRPTWLDAVLPCDDAVTAAVDRGRGHLR